MLRYVMAVVMCCVLASQAHAHGAIFGAKVIQVRVDQSGLGMVVFDKPIAHMPPACVHPSYTNALAFNANTAGGKAILAAALAAKAAGTLVAEAYGTGACGHYGGAHVEDLSYGVL